MLPSLIHIESLRQRRSEVNSNATTLANMLNQQMHQLFHDPRNFIYELIQNAEDAKATSITFRLVNNDLFISHSGESFSQHDVERICDASRDNDAHEQAKSNLKEKIGYKGIGFKSVFGISDDIAILSPETNYYFRFSKEYWEEKTRSRTSLSQNSSSVKFPWQITPIWIPQKEKENLNTNNNEMDEKAPRSAIEIALKRLQEI